MAPRNGAKKKPEPPTTTISSKLSDKPNANGVGSTNCTSGAYSAPEMPPRPAPSANAISV